MSGFKQTQINIVMKVKSIDQWKRLNCIISKETYDMLMRTTANWMSEKNPLTVWKDKDEQEHYFMKVKLSQWDSQPCNFPRMEKFVGKKVQCAIYAKEYKFTPENGTEVSGWSATLMGKTIRF